jgi:glycosyltransferase 2 family protein
MNSKKVVVTGIKLLVTALLLFFVFRSVNPAQMGRDVRSINVLLLAALLVSCWLGQLICSQRWRVFAAALNVRASYGTFVKMYFVGMFFNNGLPSLVGGDVVKAYLLSRKTSKPLKSAFVSVLQDRASGLLSLLTYGTIAIILVPIAWKGISLAAVYAVSWVAVVITGLILWKGAKLSGNGNGNQNGIVATKALGAIADLSQALRTTRLTRGEVTQVITYSMLNSGLVLIVYQQITVAAGYPVGILAFTALFPMITLVTMLPISLGGLGVREWAYVEALALLGVPRHDALLISLTTSTLTIIINFGGLPFLPMVPAELKGPPKESRGSEYRSKSQLE